MRTATLLLFVLPFTVAQTNVGCSNIASKETQFSAGVYGCSGKWTTRGLKGDATKLCQTGYHICETDAEAKQLGITSTTCDNTPAKEELFVASQGKGSSSTTCDTNDSSKDDVFGCGGSDFSSASCTVLNRRVSTGFTNNGWDLGASSTTEQDNVLHTSTTGGVLCCKNTAVCHSGLSCSTSSCSSTIEAAAPCNIDNDGNPVTRNLCDTTGSCVAVPTTGVQSCTHRQVSQFVSIPATDYNSVGSWKPKSGLPGVMYSSVSSNAAEYYFDIVSKNESFAVAAYGRNGAISIEWETPGGSILQVCTFSFGSSWGWLNAKTVCGKALTSVGGLRILHVEATSGTPEIAGFMIFHLDEYTTIDKWTTQFFIPPATCGNDAHARVCVTNTIDSNGKFKEVPVKAGTTCDDMDPSTSNDQCNDKQQCIGTYSAYTNPNCIHEEVGKFVSFHGTEFASAGDWKPYGTGTMMVGAGTNKAIEYQFKLKTIDSWGVAIHGKGGRVRLEWEDYAKNILNLCELDFGHTWAWRTTYGTECNKIIKSASADIDQVQTFRIYMVTGGPSDTPAVIQLLVVPQSQFVNIPDKTIGTLTSLPPTNCDANWKFTCWGTVKTNLRAITGSLSTENIPSLIHLGTKITGPEACADLCMQDDRCDVWQWFPTSYAADSSVRQGCYGTDKFDISTWVGDPGAISGAGRTCTRDCDQKKSQGMCEINTTTNCIWNTKKSTDVCENRPDCSNLIVGSAQLSSSENKAGTKVVITCNTNYKLVQAGNNVYTCQATTSASGVTSAWAGNAACAGICPTLSTTHGQWYTYVNGKATTTKCESVVEGTNCILSCDTGYQVADESKKVVACPTSKIWPSVSTCAVTCPALTENHGTYKEYDVAAKKAIGTACADVQGNGACQLSCGTGYTLSDPKLDVVTCSASSGTWPSTLPLCVATCSNLAPSNGVAVRYVLNQSTQQNCENMVAGGECKISCNAKYQLSNPAKAIATCAAGTWNSDMAVCDAIKCPSLNDAAGKWEVVGGTSTTCTNVKVDQECALTCNSGHQIDSGSATKIKCGQTGSWPTTLPKCEAIICPPPTVSDGNWVVFENSQATTKICENVAAASGINNNYCVLQCDTKYQPSNSEIKIGCDATGKWSKGATCSAIPPDSCANLVDLHGTWNTLDKNTNTPTTTKCEGKKEGDACTLTCDAGFDLTKTTKSVTCEAGGSWSAALVCEDKGCGDPNDSTTTVMDIPFKSKWTCSPAPSNGKWTTGTKCELTCSSGYKVSNHNEADQDIQPAVCDWTNYAVTQGWGHHVKCQRLPRECKPLTLSLSTEEAWNCTNSHAAGSTCTLKCKPDNTLSANHNIHCNDGTWSDSLYCKAAKPQAHLQCNNSMTPAHGKYMASISNSFECEPTMNDTEKCFLDCDPGYHPVGPGEILCNNGTLEAKDAGLCESNTCSTKPDPPRGGIGAWSDNECINVNEGSYCSLKCPQDYVSTGLAQCKSKSWTNLPFCQYSPRHPPPPPASPIPALPAYQPMMSGLPVDNKRHLAQGILYNLKNLLQPNTATPTTQPLTVSNSPSSGTTSSNTSTSSSTTTNFPNEKYCKQQCEATNGCLAYSWEEEEFFCFVAMDDMTAHMQQAQAPPNPPTSAANPPPGTTEKSDDKEKDDKEKKEKGDHKFPKYTRLASSNGKLLSVGGVMVDVVPAKDVVMLPAEVNPKSYWGTWVGAKAQLQPTTPQATPVMKSLTCPKPPETLGGRYQTKGGEDFNVEEQSPILAGTTLMPRCKLGYRMVPTIDGVDASYDSAEPVVCEKDGTWSPLYYNCFAHAPLTGASPTASVVAAAIPSIAAAALGASASVVLIGNTQQLAIALSCTEDDGNLAWLLKPMAFIKVSDNDSNNLLFTTLTCVCAFQMLHAILAGAVALIKGVSFTQGCALVACPSAAYILCGFLVPGVALSCFEVLFNDSTIGWKVFAVICLVIGLLYTIGLFYLAWWLVRRNRIYTHTYDRTPEGALLHPEHIPKWPQLLIKALPKYYWCSPDNMMLLKLHSSLVSSFSYKRFGYMYIPVYQVLLLLQVLFGSKMLASCDDRILGVCIISAIKCLITLIWRPFNSIVKDVLAVVMVLLVTFELLFAYINFSGIGSVPSPLAKIVTISSMIVSLLYGTVVLFEILREVFIIPKLARLDQQYHDGEVGSDLFIQDEYEREQGKSFNDNTELYRPTSVDTFPLDNKYDVYGDSTF